MRLRHFKNDPNQTTGPGPARYAMPNLTGGVGCDLTKKTYPVYSFGMNLGTSCENNYK